MLWLAYARAGKELEVHEALAEIGITSRCARVVEVKRIGKRHRPDVFIDPLLPNYLFVECTAEQYLDAVAIKNIAPTMSMIPKCDLAEIAAFLDRADAALDERLARINAGERLQQFTEGELLEVLGGPLTGMIARFRRIVDDDRGIFPSVEAEVDMMGRPVPTKLDALHVRKVG